MESYFDVMAQHPNCLLAVDATDGGKWKSNFHAYFYTLQMINFKIHPKTWTNFNSSFNTDSGIKYTDDFEFEIDFEWNLTPEEFINNNQALSIFYNIFTDVPIGIYMYADSRIGIWTSCRKTNATGSVSPIGSVVPISLSKGEHNLKLKYSYSKNTQEVIIDDNILYSISLYNSSLTLSDFITSNSPVSSFNGGIYSATLTKTTDGARTKVWEAQKNEIQTNLSVMPTAPTGSGSFEETHGLLTKTNVEAENNYFKHTTDDVGYIETPLDLRGYSGDFTMMAKVLVAKNEVAGTTRKDVFLMQDNINYTNGSFVFFILQATTTNRYELNFYIQNSNNSTITISYTIPNDFNWAKPHVFAVNYVASSKVFSLFLDGEVVATSTNSTFDSFYNGTAVNTQIACKAGGFAPDVMKQYNTMFFDKALSADEIKILSDSLLPNSTTSEEPGTALLCTTPTNLTSNTSNADWECYTEPISTGTDAHSDTAYMAAAGFTGYDLNTANGRWAADKGTALTDTSAGVRFVWKRTDLAEWAVKRVIIGDCWKSVFPQRIQHFILQGSNDGTTWTNIGEKQTPTIAANVYGEQTFDYLSNTEKYKYWAINCNYDITWTDAAYAQLGAAANKIQFTNEI